MRRHLILAATVVTVAFSANALAQSAVVEIAPEQRTQIKQYIVKEKIKPVTVKEHITVGATLPASVELHAVPSTWGPSVTKYRYVYTDNHVYLVEPSSRKVITVVD
jgi:hypothetical protein